MNMLFAKVGEELSWNIGNVLFELTDKIVLTSDSIPLVYLLGTKGGSSKLRGGMEYLSDADMYGYRFRHHEIILHTQAEVHERYLHQKAGGFEEGARFQPQTRDVTCAGAFEVFGKMAENVTTPGGGAFHAVSYILDGSIATIVKLVPHRHKVISGIKRALDVRKSLVKAGEMTNSVQMLITKFEGFVCLF